MRIEFYDSIINALEEAALEALDATGEYNFQTVNNPNAKGLWFEDWADGGKYANKVRENYAAFYKRFGGI